MNRSFILKNSEFLFLKIRKRARALTWQLNFDFFEHQVVGCSTHAFAWIEHACSSVVVDTCTAVRLLLLFGRGRFVFVPFNTEQNPSTIFFLFLDSGTLFHYSLLFLQFNGIGFQLEKIAFRLGTETFFFCLVSFASLPD